MGQDSGALASESGFLIIPNMHAYMEMGESWNSTEGDHVCSGFLDRVRQGR